MKCTNKWLGLCLSMSFVILLTGCGSKEFTMKYDTDTNISSYSVVAGADDRAVPFAKGLCVVSEDIESTSEIESGSDSYGAAVLFDVNNAQPVYSRNCYATLYPASLTKVMTAIVAMKHGQKDDLIVCTDDVLITEEGAQLCGFKPGDTMTLDQAMHGLLMYSGNDAAVAIADGIAGSVESFCDLMNEEALSLGATGTHFVNPNGLHDENHYTTPYDMYLIFNEAVKYDWFNEIINMQGYTTSYATADGSQKEITFNTTNLYLKGDAIAPSSVTVIGGKTGTTMAAGNNLVLLSRDAGGNPFISVVMKAKDKGILYDKMTSLLGEIK